MSALGSPIAIRSASGLVVQANHNGSIRRIDHGAIVLTLFLGTEIEGGPANLHLRRHGATIESTPLLGPHGPALVHVDERTLVAYGTWRDVRFTATLVLAHSAPAWFWHVSLENTGTTAQTVDLVYAQDLALAHYGAVRTNEYYVSQYVDYTPLAHPERGTVLAVRQNLPMDGRHPWALVGSLGRGESIATDALALHGLATREGKSPIGLAAPRLPGRWQHEHSMAVIQSAPVVLAPGASVASGFFARFMEDHGDPSSDVDLAVVDHTLDLPEATNSPPASPPAGHRPVASLFGNRAALAVRDLDEGELTGHFGPERRVAEYDDGRLLSFFAGDRRHVVLRTKELQVLRPHGQVLRTGDGLAPDEASLTSTVWMSGVFHSMVTQGHVNINRALSTVRSYLGLLRAAGQRVFVEMDDGFLLLDVPSAFEMTPNGARWIYAHAGGVIEVRSRALTDRHALLLSIAVLEGAPRRILVTHHVALGGDDGADAVPVRFTRDADGVVIHAADESDVGRRFPGGFFRIDAVGDTPLALVGGDELLFGDGRSRRQPHLVLVTAPTRTAYLRITGGLVPTGTSGVRSKTPPPDDAGTERAFWNDMTGGLALAPPAGCTQARAVEALQEILPWFAHDALVHYLAPRGLEQFSGGGWGTRDVSQGPVELLLALGRWDALRALLRTIFAAQNPDGDWPQWFTFFDRDRGIRAPDSHGDVVFWPVLALAQYVLASDDPAILDEPVAFFHPDGPAHAESASLLDHVARALSVITARTIPGTVLAAYGHGDWNDSLQPADPTLRERLCSTWTVTLDVQTRTTLARALRRAGCDALAASVEAQCAQIRDAFRTRLLHDGTLAGFAYFPADGAVEYWLHPQDRRTGIRYRLLPMIHAIMNDLLDPDEARAHVGYMRDHLLGVDGARLFDRPVAYLGGRQRLFQRAETSTFFGREIGLMYMHAHLRYAEAMARLGDAEAFFLALRQAVPAGIHDIVRNATRRQANCYYSSSDAVLPDRYAASARYAEVRRGDVPLDGGWRVYSSGAGIAFRLIHQCFLGLRRGRATLAIDPVIPRTLDGLQAHIVLAERRVRVTYRIAARGCGPVSVTLNGVQLPFEREANPYRDGGVTVPMSTVTAHLRDDTNELVIGLG